MKTVRSPWSLYGLFCFLTFLLFCLSSCVVKSSPVSYYKLSAMNANQAISIVPEDLDVALGVGPITLPEYLKKSQIAVSRGGNRYTFDDSHRWAGMLEKDIASVVASNLALMLDTDRIDLFPWRQYFVPDYQVLANIVQFDSDLENVVTLSVRWTIVTPKGGEVLATGKSEIIKKLLQPNYTALVSAESLALGSFSKELAEELKTLILQNR